MKIALAGNPNSGKTTMFNAITGKSEKVGNWAGVTVDIKEGIIKNEFTGSDKEINVIDLPGAYSISPYTSEESITKDFVKEQNPDVIINVVDSTNISRSLFFTTQLLELGIPVVVALNKTDLSKKMKNEINDKILSKELNCPVIFTSAENLKNNGLGELVKKAITLKGNNQKACDIKGLSSAGSESDDKARYAFVNKITKTTEKRAVDSSKQKKQDGVDRIVAHKWLGIPIFIAIIWLVFSISQVWVGPPVADLLVGIIDTFYGFVEGLLGDVNPVVGSLLLDGIIGGVGAVLGFLPLIMALFFCLALLEDSGYMARVAVVMDRFFKKIGLSGKSVIPIIVGTGCAIPGIMATRTIKNERQRRTTSMLTPFIPCGAKLPVIALFAGLFFDEAAWVGTSMYVLGIVMIIIGGLVIQKITGGKLESDYFIMELPEYKFPSIKKAFFSMLDRGKAFIIKAGTIILLCNAIVQLLQTFNWQFQVVSETAPETSMLATIASPFALLFIPLGFGIWQFAAATITGFIAKENVVGTLAVCFGVTNFIDVDELALVGGVEEVAAVFGMTAVAAMAFLVFNLFSPPCFAAIGAMNSEMESPKWVWGAIGFQLGVAYVLAFLIYQIGTLVVTGALGTGFLMGLVLVAIIVGIIGYLMATGPKLED